LVVVLVVMVGLVVVLVVMVWLLLVTRVRWRAKSQSK
jgi:hypothetical protein